MKHHFWEERYAQEEYIYGKEPNAFLKEVLPTLKAGKILFPAEGEGRNAVFAAKNGWDVSAFDASTEGKKKALALAEQHGTQIDYQVSTLEDVDYPMHSFDALALVFAHFPENNRKDYHHKLASFIKPNGTLIIEGFSKRQSEFQVSNPNAGGPKDQNMLYDLEALKADFKGFDFLKADETEVELSEGAHHVGLSSVVRIVAIKKQLDQV